VDAGQISQVLVNLAVNARDAMPTGGTLTIRTSACEVDGACATRLPGLKPGTYAVLTVSDTGSGMSDHVRRHLFEPFFTTKPAGKGTGLGLATVYGIVTQCGGHIEVASTLGSGSVFQILIPVACVEARPLVEPVSEARARGHETVLLVEDEPAVRSLAREALVTHGYSVVEASGPAEALELAQALNGSLCLLVTDVVMPGMGGLELSHRMRARKPGLKVLFVSGYTDDAMVRHGILTSEVDFLQKPFGASTLARKVRQVLDSPTG
jgi:CheY-like chemotaxis protein